MEICFVLEDDFSVVVKFLWVIFEDRVEVDYDYIFNRFNDWLVELKWFVFVVVIKDCVVGFWIFVIVNEGKSLVCEVEMIYLDFCCDDF